jgi:hypothetical protein
MNPQCILFLKWLNQMESIAGAAGGCRGQGCRLVIGIVAICVGEAGLNAISLSLNDNKFILSLRNTDA